MYYDTVSGWGDVIASSKNIFSLFAVQKWLTTIDRCDYK